MHSKKRDWPASSVLLAVSGIVLIVVGFYFLFLRPALLPEGVRYMTLSSAELQSVGARLVSWLRYVFRVMGDCVTATGVLSLTLAVTSFRHRQPWAVAAPPLRA
ncbi:hypothetical protein [Bradyrhizobium sp. CCBAU 51753]|uniref:hypothetical protein n=1 Tax=Bradyrhizobium sp. CCBAU 51753 TaxID=1325100 RepID=UPI001FED74F4|nr:hypothetical protein [Bradyrhizobium sp. CCBAU 51753]